ncbi:NAD(P)/FAD-dependent oxidoreductase [Cohnella panacarvi]|uniref:NAD(P)/FAD-dependent oxidoreductase n=1 Tax=Cohnella panacarvi TaxID=400776 RepID=UPI000479098E|nr:FAD-dependent oxidoreductase [Cohnella panacarvi]
MRIESDVVVIGAGIAGSSMAYRLAKDGWKVVLLDKNKYPRHKACGEFLSPEARSTLRRFELEEHVRALNPAEIVTVRIHSESGGRLEIPLPGQAWGVSRYALDAALQEAAAMKGASIHTPCAVSRVTQSERGNRVEGASENGPLELFGRVAIGAWGRRPFSANRTNAHAGGRTYVGIKSHYASSDRQPIVDLYFFRGGYVGVSPVEGNRLNVAALVTCSAFQSLGASSALERILDGACKHVPEWKERLAGATPLTETRSATSPVLVRRTPTAWSDIPCIGDSLAVIPPFCGDGMSMALRSSELCAPLADDYLRGIITETEWRIQYTGLIERQFSGALRWGSVLERTLTQSVLCGVLLRLGAIWPKAAQALVRATRLGSD